MRRRISLLLGLCVLVACGGDKALRYSRDFSHAQDDVLRMNQLQALGTHNSYHYRVERPTIPDWDYDMAPLGEQLRDQGVRALELDIHWDAATGEFQVMHIPLLDDGTRCLRFHDCLAEIRDFSDENPGHHPLFVQIELKYPMQADATSVDLDHIDQAIRDVFSEDVLVTPAMVQGNSPTLRDAIANQGWPTLGQSRGHTLFFLDCDRDLCLRYTDGNGSIATRAMFPDSVPTDDFAAVMVANSPDAAASSLVQQGFIVRVFADSSADVIAGTNDLDAALASGAQILSSDVPVPRTDGITYYAQIPDGTPSRCNPITAATGCVSSDIETPALLRGR